MTGNMEKRRRSIALIGLRGSGKTTVGRELAKLLHTDHRDSDEAIVAEAGQSIAAIFQAYGVAEFRKLEREAIADLVRNPPGVISVGGGAIMDALNVAALRSVAFIVWLTAPPAMLWERVQNDPRTEEDRPALTAHAGADEMTALFIQRQSLYRAAADLIVDTQGKTPTGIAQEIIALIEGS